MIYGPVRLAAASTHSFKGRSMPSIGCCGRYHSAIACSADLLDAALIDSHSLPLFLHSPLWRGRDRGQRRRLNGRRRHCRKDLRTWRRRTSPIEPARRAAFPIFNIAPEKEEEEGKKRVPVVGRSVGLGVPMQPLEKEGKEGGVKRRGSRAPRTIETPRARISG